jgi:hypothetical protein
MKESDIILHWPHELAQLSSQWILLQVLLLLLNEDAKARKEQFGIQNQ